MADLNLSIRIENLDKVREALGRLSGTQARVAYAVLLLVSIPIPLFHYRILGDVLWAIRYPWGLHPVPILILWNLGAGLYYMLVDKGQT